MEWGGVELELWPGAAGAEALLTSIRVSSLLPAQ